MIAAMQQGVCTTMEDCMADWVTPLMSVAEESALELVEIRRGPYPLHVRTREAPAPVRGVHDTVKHGADR